MKFDCYFLTNYPQNRIWPGFTEFTVRIMADDVQTYLHVEMFVDILITIFEKFFDKHIVQEFAEKIIKNFAKTHLNITL